MAVAVADAELIDDEAYKSYYSAMSNNEDNIIEDVIEEDNGIRFMMAKDPPEDDFINLDLYGIFSGDNSYEIRPVDITIEKFRHPLYDNDSPEENEILSGRRLIIRGQENPFFLVSGINGIEERNIPKVQIMEKEIVEQYSADFAETSVLAFIKPGEELNVVYREKRLRFTTEGNSENFKDEFITLDEPYRIFVSNEEVDKQLLIEAEQFELENQIFGFTWFGELDNDSIPDALLSVSTHYALRVHALYRSTYAGQGEVLKEVARFGFGLD